MKSLVEKLDYMIENIKVEAHRQATSNDILTGALVKIAGRTCNYSYSKIKEQIEPELKDTSINHRAWSAHLRNIWIENKITDNAQKKSEMYSPINLPKDMILVRGMFSCAVCGTLTNCLINEVRDSKYICSELCREIDKS